MNKNITKSISVKPHNNASLQIFAGILLSGLLLIGCQKNEKKPNMAGFLISLLYIKTYPQASQDRDTSVIVDTTLVRLYNKNIAGTVGTAVNVSGSCPVSGTFSITGTTATSSGTTTTNLSFVLNSCKETITSLSMTGNVALTGTVIQTGTVGGIQNTTRSSSSLQLKGTQSDPYYLVGTPVIWDSTCAFTITSTSSLASGTVCGRSFSY